MRPKEFAIPEREHNESVEDYMMRYGLAVQQYNKSICNAIDSQAVKARFQSSCKSTKDYKKTVHDIISGNPDRVAAFKAGKFNPFDM